MTDDSVHIETDSVMEASVSNVVPGLERTGSGGQTDMLTNTVERLQPYLMGRSDVHTSVVDVRQSSNIVLPAVRSSQTSSGAITVSTAGLVDLAGLITDSAVQPGTSRQYSRSAVTMLVNSGNQCVVLPVTQQHATPAIQATASAVSGQRVYQFLQSQQTLTASHDQQQQQRVLVDVMPQTTTKQSQYLTTPVVPVDYNAQQQQHR